MNENEQRTSRLILCGPPGSGKTKKLLGIFHDELNKHREENVLLLVPDSITREHIREVACRSIPAEYPTAFIDKSIHTIDSLLRLLGAVPDVSQLHLDALIDKWLGEGLIDAAHTRILAKQDSRYSLARAIATLRIYGYGAKELEKHKESVLAYSPILLVVMKLWEDWLNSTGSTDELGSIRKAVSIVYEKKWETVLIDGFTEIIPPQFDLIKTIIENSSFAVVGIDPCLPPSDQLLDKFLQLGFSEIKTIADSSQRWESDCALSWLAGMESWRADSRDPSACPEIVPGELLLIEAGDPRIEASAIARQVARYVLEGYSYSDIAILVPSLTSYRSLLESEFRRSGIPLRIFADIPLAETGPGNLSISLLSLLSEDWNDERVVSLLSNPGLTIPNNEAVLAGYQTSSIACLNSKDEWIKWAESNNANSVLSLFNEIDSLISPESMNPSCFGSRLIEIINARLRRSWKNLDDEIVADESWAWQKSSNVIVDACNALETVAGEMSPGEISRFVLTHIQRASATRLDRRRDCVNAMTFLGARSWSVPVVFVTGMSREYFPREINPDPFLPDSLCRSLDPPLPASSDLREREQALFRVAVTRARKKLILTIPESDLSGSPILPSMPLIKFREWLGDKARAITIRVSHFQPLSIEDLVFPHDVAAYAIFHKCDDSDFLNAIERRIGFSLSQPICSEHYDAPVISDATSLLQAAMGTKERPIFPSYLNDLAQCRFLFFASRVLRLREPGRYRIIKGLDDALWGGIVHASLAEWHRRNRLGDWEDIVYSKADELLSGIPRTSYIQSVLRHIVESLRRFEIFEKQHILPLGYTPTHVELLFGADKGMNADQGRAGEGPVEWHLDDAHSIWLGGRIDRVDVGKNNTALIIDYKKSSSGVNKVLFDLRDGSDFQMASYIVLVEKGLGLKVQMAFFVPLQDLYDDKWKKCLVDEEIEEIVSKKHFRPIKENSSPSEHLSFAAGELIELIKTIESGKIAPRPKNSRQCGRRCLFYDLCRYLPISDEDEEEGDEE